MNIAKGLKMPCELEKIVLNSIDTIIKNTASDKKLEKIRKTHQIKLHFIPIKYRIFGGVLQSMNIQFGNFIEELIRQLVANSGYEILKEFSGKKSNKFKISPFADTLIDNYITKAQSDTNFNLQQEFHTLKTSILSDKNGNTIKTNHDIDLLFKDKKGQIYYIEIKYNDDHDTDKFIALNRKIIKTYAYLVREFGVDIKPILFYFNNKKMKGNIYLPENECIYRGERFFKEFLKFNYANLQEIFENFAESSENILRFNKLYQDIMQRELE